MVNVQCKCGENIPLPEKKNILQKIGIFIKNDWKNTRGKALIDIALFALLLGNFLNNVFLAIWVDPVYMSVAIWVMAYMMIYTLLLLTLKQSRMWRELCKDTMKLNDQIMEETTNILRSRIEITIKKSTPQEEPKVEAQKKKNGGKKTKKTK